MPSFPAVISVLTALSLLHGASLELASAADTAPYESVAPRSEWIDAQALTMLALERETLANALAAYVTHHVAPYLPSAPTAKSHLWCRRLLGLALVLHPQNPRALATDRALMERSALPVLEDNHPPDVLARLLFHRARQLEKGAAADQKIAPFLMAVAAFVSPYFEAAVYASEKRRLRDGALNWRPVLGQSPSLKTP